MGCCDFDNLKGQCHNMFSLDPFLLMILTHLDSLFIYAEVFLDNSFDFAEIFACAKSPLSMTLRSQKSVL